MTPNPSTGRKRRTERIYERAADPAETADRALEPKDSEVPLASRDEPAGDAPEQHDPHHRLNTPVGDPDPVADSDPYRTERPEDESDRASGVRGTGQRPDRP
jgi:hypothetical protein